VSNADDVQIIERDEREWLLEIAKSMVELAISDMLRGRGRADFTGRGRRARDAADWTFARPFALFSFDSACGILGLDPSATRAAIRARTGWSE
jgi:hypothetical protein